MVKCTKQKCVNCKWAPAPQANIDDPWQAMQPPPPPAEEPVLPDVTQQRLHAIQMSEQVALALARNGEKGFQHLDETVQRSNQSNLSVGYRAFVRLALIEDHSKIPPTVRKQASHCGGVKPHDWVRAFPDTPLCADPGNEAYEVYVNQLLCTCRREVLGHADDETTKRIVDLQTLNREHKGDVVEAALAAANYAYCVQETKAMEWATLEGGTHAEGDLPT